jgi:hypothetical protein
MNALVFLYKRVLKGPLERKMDAVRAERRATVPVVLTREYEVNTRKLMPTTLGKHRYAAPDGA